MWMLADLSVVAIAIVIERLFFFAASTATPRVCCAQIGQKIAADDLDGAIRCATRTRACCRSILRVRPRARREEPRRHHRRALDRADGEPQLARAQSRRHRYDRRHRAVRRPLRNRARHHPRLPRHRAQGQLDARRRRGRRFGSADHDRRRPVRRRRLGYFLQLLQDAHQGVQPRDDRRGQPAGRDAALPQHRRADPDRPLPADRP